MAWVIWEIVIRLGISVSSPLFQIAGFPAAFAPAVAAFVVRKWITREGFTDAGLRLNLRKWPYYLVAWLLPLLVVGCIVVLSPPLGLGRPDFTLVRGLKYLMPARVAAHAASPTLVRLLPLLITAILAVPIFFGEEFGWRGYLQLRLIPERPVWSAVTTGLIWSAWHLPVNLRGYAFPDHPLVGALLVFSVAAIFLSIIFGWLFFQTGSIWSSCLAHSAMNVIGASLTLLFFAGGASLLFVLDIGILAWIPLGALSAWIVSTGQLSPAKKKTQIADGFTQL